jgi:hypothetical protein
LIKGEAVSESNFVVQVREGFKPHDVASDLIKVGCTQARTTSFGLILVIGKEADIRRVSGVEHIEPEIIHGIW